MQDKGWISAFVHWVADGRGLQSSRKRQDRVNVQGGSPDASDKHMAKPINEGKYETSHVSNDGH